jgi:hypothetical protein
MRKKIALGACVIFGAFIVLMFLLIATGVLNNLSNESERRKYVEQEIPAMRLLAEQISGVRVKEIIDPGYRDELNVTFVLEVHQEQTLYLRQPTTKSFTGGGPITISQIDDCKLGRMLNVDSSGRYVDLRFSIISEVVHDYKVVKEKIKSLGLCAEQ